MTQGNAVPQRLAAIRDDTRHLGFDQACEDSTGMLLRALAASKPQGHFLELGTGTGVGLCWILDGMDASSKLTSVDSDARAQDIARRHLGSDSRLTLVKADAAAFLADASLEQFDYVFADAFVGKFSMLEKTLSIIKPGGMLILDDLLPQPNWPRNHQPNVDRLIGELEKRADLRTAFLNWGTGIIIASRTLRAFSS